MKKILCFLLALMMCACLVACNSSGDVENLVSEPETRTAAADAEIEEYIAAQGAEFISSLEESFSSSSGLACKTSVSVVDAGIVFDVNIEGIDGAPDSVKQELQQAYDAQQETFDGLYDELKAELPVLEYFQMNINEVDGDLLAKIYAE